MTLTFFDAMKVMEKARVSKPALIKDGDSYHAISGTKVIGTGRSYKGALIAAKLLPHEQMKPVVIPFVAVGSDVLRGTAPVCVARSSNMARRIANALNHYKHSDRGL
jgi:hypothetical protein